MVQLTLLEHLWMWDYLNALASGDVWIIIQPFFRRLEPQAAAGSRKGRRRGGGIRRWRWRRWRRRSGGDIMGGKQTKKKKNMWREWHLLENLSNHRQPQHMWFACIRHLCTYTNTLTHTYIYLFITHVLWYTLSNVFYLLVFSLKLQIVEAKTTQAYYTSL